MKLFHNPRMPKMPSYIARIEAASLLRATCSLHRDAIEKATATKWRGRTQNDGVQVDPNPTVWECVVALDAVRKLARIPRALRPFIKQLRALVPGSI